MAYTKYSLTPANNTATPPDGAPEGMLPSAVNDTMRDMMAQIRDCGDGIRDGTYTMTAAKITGGTITGTTVTSNTFSSSGATITGGTINGTAIGGTTAAAGKFTTLEATGVTTVQAGTVSAPAITTTGDTNTGIFFPAADTIAFTEGGVESMRIDSSGNVGIGVTPSAWSAYKGLNIGLNTTLAGNTSGSTALLSTNAYFDGSSYKYISTDAATQYQQNTGEHIWRTAASGSAGATLTFTERMRIDSSGNVLVGITSARANAGDVQVSKGISFPATQSAQSDANTLDDYEEGTWTPAVNSGFTSPAYSVRAGTYTKVGNVVTFTLRIDMSSSTRAGSVIQFSLPFTSKNSTTAHNGGGASWAYLYEAIGNSTTTNVPMLYINNNAATMDCYSTTGSAFLGTDLSTANPYFYIGGSYLTA